MAAGLVQAAALAQCGLLFVVAGVGKAAAPDGFRAALARQGVVPPLAHGVLARSLPAAEVGLGSWLLSGVRPQAALAAAAAGLGALAAYHALLAARGERCGCLGIWQRGGRRRVELAATAVNSGIAVAGVLAARRAAPWPGTVSVPLAAGALAAAALLLLHARRT